jgi:uncharacterized membrane protein (DUF485 family)
MSRAVFPVLADAVLLLHGLFIAWVVLGGLAVWRRPWLAAAHLPAAVWGVWIEWSGGFCPLTPLEQRLRIEAGQGGYGGSFVEHYLGALIYPDGLTRESQFALGAVVLLLNLLVYGLLLWRARRRQDRGRRNP